MLQPRARGPQDCRFRCEVLSPRGRGPRARWGRVSKLSQKNESHPPQQLTIRLAFHQQAADQLGSNLLGGAGEAGLGEVLRGLGGYGSGLAVE